MSPETPSSTLSPENQNGFTAMNATPSSDILSSMPAYGAASEAPTPVTSTPETPTPVASTPEMPEAPEIPEMPEVPEMPATPALPETHKLAAAEDSKASVPEVTKISESDEDLEKLAQDIEQAIAANQKHIEDTEARLAEYRDLADILSDYLKQIKAQKSVITAPAAATKATPVATSTAAPESTPPAITTYHDLPGNVIS